MNCICMYLIFVFLRGPLEESDSEQNTMCLLINGMLVEQAVDASMATMMCLCVCVYRSIDKRMKGAKGLENVCVRYCSCTAFVCIPADTHQKETCEAHFF